MVLTVQVLVVQLVLAAVKLHAEEHALMHVLLTALDHVLVTVVLHVLQVVLVNVQVVQDVMHIVHHHVL